MSANTKFERLLDWVRENGGFIHSSIYLDDQDPDNRVIRVKCPHQFNTELIKIPSKCCLGSDKAVSEEKSANLINTCVHLIVQLAQGEKSFWAPFLEMFPTADNLSHLPLYKHTRHELADLQQVSPIFAGQLGQYFRETDTVLAKLKERDDIPKEFKEYHCALYAVAIYHSRAWDSKGFIPVIDLIQHENNIGLSNNVVLGQEHNSFVTRTFLKKDEELTWFYSINNNLVLYANYGIPDVLAKVFIPASLIFDLEADTTVSRYQRDCLEANKVAIQKELKIIYTDDGIHSDALVVARILQLDERDLGYIRADNDGELKPLVFKDRAIVSARNETAMLRALMKQLRDYREQMESSRENPKYPEITGFVEKNRAVVNTCIEQLEDHWRQVLYGNCKH